MTRRRNIDEEKQPPKKGPHWLALLVFILAVLVLLLSCAGCAQTPPVAQLPIYVPCRTEPVPMPPLPSAGVPAAALRDPDVKLKAILADRGVLLGHIDVLNGTLQACPKP